MVADACRSTAGRWGDRLPGCLGPYGPVFCSRPARVTSRAYSRMSMSSLMLRTEPSPNAWFATPGWKEYGSLVPKVMW